MAIENKTPNRSPQRADPRLKNDMPDAVTTKVIIAASRVSGLSREDVRLEINVPNKASPASEVMSWPGSSENSEMTDAPKIPMAIYPMPQTTPEI